MIITQADLDEFEQMWDRSYSDDGMYEFYRWLANNPQVFMATGYQEFVGAHQLPIYKALAREGVLDLCERPLFRDFHGNWFVVSMVHDLPNEQWDGLRLEALHAHRAAIDKLKHERESIEHDYDEHLKAEYVSIEEENRFNATEKNLVRVSRQLEKLYSQGEYDPATISLPSFHQIMDAATNLLDNPLVDPTTFVSPRLWTPYSQSTGKQLLQHSSLQLISAIQNENVVLADLHWRQFEDIVAEVLRSLGMEIHCVRESPQGGRDIIARSQLVPNSEVVTIAIEVKHRDVVDRPLVQQALYQNRHFPALMFVTSGRFTSGVIREASKPENRLRLFLKDGIAMREMIHNCRSTGSIFATA